MMINKKLNIVSNPKLRYGVVAYIDFLGAKKIITNNELSDSREDQFLVDILNIYKESLDILKFHAEYGNYKINYRIFSDNIIICSEISNKLDIEKKIEIIGEIIAFVGYFQGLALERKYKTRGAITYGKFYINDMLVWGKAVVDVVSMEENISIYPRVIIDYKLIEYLETNINNIGFNEIKIDEIDGLFYSDFVWLFKDRKDEIQNIQKWLRDENNTCKDMKIVAKNNWIINKLRCKK